MQSDLQTTDRWIPQTPDRDEVSGVRDTIVDDAPSGLLAIQPRPSRRIGGIIADRYQLRTLLGSGAAGGVFEAVDLREPSRRVAVKVLHDRHSANRELVARFLREARIAQTIAHPGVVTIAETARDDRGRCYIVMELLEGMDLAAAMEQGLLTTGHVVEIARQLLSVLAAAHLRGIVHRDVKPENIFLCEDEQGYLRVKLLDFGIAKITTAARTVDTLQGLALGTPYYMSPEQARGEPPGPASDLWSLGAVMFHALTGRPPHDDDQLGRLLERIVTKRAPSLGEVRPDLDPRLIAVVDRALDPSLARRWSSAAEMLGAVDRL